MQLEYRDFPDITFPDPREARNSKLMKFSGKILSLLVFAFLTVEAQQPDIRGVVSDSASGERIPYANLVVVGLNRGAAANASGYYVIPSLPPGEYHISASAVGYVKQTQTVILSTHSVNLDFHLGEETIKINEVVVSGQMKPELLKVQTSVHVIDKTELERVPVGTQADVLRSIQILPGIVSTSDVNSQFYVRGGAGDENLFLLDGMKIYNPFHAFGLFSTFDPEIVRTTEVYTGAFPADFGGRLSAVVNLRSKDGNSHHFAGLANVNFLSSKIQVEGPIGNSIQAVFTGRKSLFQSTLKTYLKQPVPLSFYDAFAKVTTKSPTAPDRYSAEAFFTHDFLPSNDSSIPAYSWDTRAFAVTGNFLMSERLFWDLSLSMSNYEASRIVNDESIAPTDNKINEFGLRGTITDYTSSDDLYFFGFDIDFPATEYNFLGRSGDLVHLSETLLQFGLWFRYQLKGDVFNADLGLRTEVGNYLRWGTLESALEPRASISFDLPDQWLAKLAFGRFTQGVITVTNEDDILPIFTPWVVIPLSLRPEIAYHYVVGLEGPLTEYLSVSLEGFYKQYPSLVTYNRDKLDVSQPDYLNSEGHSLGGEVLLRFGTSFFDSYAAYTLAKVVIDQNGFSYVPRYDRRHTINLLTVLHPVKNIDVSFRWEFGSGLPYTQSYGFYEKRNLGSGYPNDYMFEVGTPTTIYGPKNAARLPNYHRLDIGATWRIVELLGIRSILGVNVTNVYDQKNLFYFDRNTGERYNMIGFFPSAMFTLEFRP